MWRPYAPRRRLQAATGDYLSGASTHSSPGSTEDTGKFQVDSDGVTRRPVRRLCNNDRVSIGDVQAIIAVLVEVVYIKEAQHSEGVISPGYLESAKLPFLGGRGTRSGIHEDMRMRPRLVDKEYPQKTSYEDDPEQAPPCQSCHSPTLTLTRIKGIPRGWRQDCG